MLKSKKRNSYTAFAPNDPKNKYKYLLVSIGWRKKSQQNLSYRDNNDKFYIYWRYWWNQIRRISEVGEGFGVVVFVSCW